MNILQHYNKVYIRETWYWFHDSYLLQWRRLSWKMSRDTPRASTITSSTNVTNSVHWRGNGQQANLLWNSKNTFLLNNFMRK